MFNFRFPHFGYFYPYNRVPFNYINKANMTTNSNVINEKNNNSNYSSNVKHDYKNKCETDNNSVKQNDINFNNKAKSSITDNSHNTANINGFLNFIPRNIGPISINVEGFENVNKPLFELLGIKLFLDDIIIICILIFLYQQKVQDESLYLILILLLLS